MIFEEKIHSKDEISWTIRTEGKVPLVLTWQRDTPRLLGGYEAAGGYIRLSPAGPGRNANEQEIKLYENSHIALSDTYDLILLSEIKNMDNLEKAKAWAKAIGTFYSEIPIGSTSIFRERRK